MMKSTKFDQSFPPADQKNLSCRELYEVVIILILTFVAQFIWREFSLLFASIPTMYLFIERYLRRRTWAEIGFSIRKIPRDVVANWLPILLVSIIIQFLVVWTTKNWMPIFLDHVIARFPLTIDQSLGYLPMLLIGTLWEEINYRALFQDRLSWFIPAPVAIGIVSVIFGIGHWAQGNSVIVTIDILLVILDSVFYGIIFARSKNVFVSWIAHFLANLFAISFFLIL